MAAATGMIVGIVFLAVPSSSPADKLMSDSTYDDVTESTSKTRKKIKAVGGIISGISVSIGIPSLISFIRNKTRVKQIP